MVSQKKEPDKLPPNQYTIPKILLWGIEHPGIINILPNIRKEEFKLIIDGEVDSPLKLDWMQFLNLKQSIDISNFHCVEGWSVLNQKWEGVLFKDLIKIIKVKNSAKFVWFECADGYNTSLPLSYLMEDHVILAHRLNDEDLSQPLGGPVRLIVPNKYAYKSPMWITKMTFLSKNKLGYWEKGIYSDSADPWKNDRYRK
ncbi:molybdopterin-dependent oxidoreductase [Candidatus Bathyarchaeota archaeon]|nr:molybdopterin-dependent oxidoreductase [Candidatus Bathyarchaeota archaeon]